MQDTSITRILQELRDRNEVSLDALLPHVYDELRRLANIYLSHERAGHTLQPTALVHEAYLRLIGQDTPDWQSRAHFFGISARIMRQILIDHARGRNRQKRGGGLRTQVAFPDEGNVSEAQPLDILVVDEAMTKLEKLDSRQAAIVEMKFFAGLTVEEIAEVLNISPATVKREWSTAKLFLYKAINGSCE